MSDPVTPVLPPIPQVSLDTPLPIYSPTAKAVESLSSSIDTDMPISEVVAALKNSAVPVNSSPALTEVIPNVPSLPVPSPSINQNSSPAIVNPHLVETALPTPSNSIPVAPTTMAPPSKVSPSPEIPASVAPAQSTPTKPAEHTSLFEDPDLIKVPGSA